MLRFIPVLLLSLLLMFGHNGPVVCAATPEGISTERAMAALERANEHYRAGKLNEAAGLLRGFVVSQARSPLVNNAYLQLARIHADLNEPEAALDYLGKIAPSAWTPTAELLRGEQWIRSGQTINGLRLLLEMDPAELPMSERQNRWLVMADAALHLDQKQRALYFLYQALLTDGALSTTDVLDRCRTLLDNRFNQADLQEVAFMYVNTPLAYLAQLKLGWLALESGQKDQARKWARAVLMAPPGFAYIDEAMSLQSQLVDPSQVQRAIGVLLPLSGRYASFGTLVQRGMQLAQETFRPHVPVRFLYRDTAGEALQTDQMVAELAIGERVIGLAGPLVGDAASAAAARANIEQVPLLTISQREGLAETSLYVFRNSLTAQLQVQTLLNHAIQDRGLTSFAMLTPETRQGEIFAELFRQEVALQGAELIAAEKYTSEQTDFRRQVNLLLGRDPNFSGEDEEETSADGTPNKKEPPPFQALFIPDYVDRISLIAPQLEFYGLDGVQLLGTNGWNDPELLQTAGRFVEGAIFVDGFFRYSPLPFVQEFVDRYYNTFGQEPTILEAQGYDAAGILLNLFMRFDIRNREDLRRGLNELQDYPGVTGATRFDHLGEASKVLFLLQIQNNSIVQIN